MRYSQAVLILMLSFWLVSRLSQEFPVIPEDKFSENQAAHPRVGASTIPQFTLHDTIVINNNGDFVSQGFSGSGTIDDPYCIEGFEIRPSTGSTALIQIQNINVHFRISNNIIINNIGYGIYLSASENGTIFNNTVSNNLIGISLGRSNNNIISNNRISNNSFGIALDGSNNNNISNNTISNNGIGISLGSSYSEVLQMGSKYNIISDNTVSYNDGSGILIQDSDNNVISTNIVSNNSEYGISLVVSSYCNVSRNVFIGNNPNGTSQAYNGGQDNIFDQNYWDDGVEDTSAPNPDFPPSLSENFLVGVFLIAIILPILGILILKQRRT